MRDVLAQVGVEEDVGSTRAGEFAFEGKPDLIGDLRTCAVEAQQVPSTLLEDVAGADVTEPDCHAVLVLDVVEVLGMESDDRATFGGVLHEYRLHQRLRNVQHRAWAAGQVVAVAQVTGAPCLESDDFFTGQARGEQRVPHLVPRSRIAPRFLLHAQVSENLRGALVGDVRPGGVRHPGKHRDSVDSDSVRGQGQGGCAAGGPEPDDHDVGVVAAAVIGERHECRGRQG